MEQHNENQILRELRIKWPKLNVTITVKMHELNTALVDLLWDTLPYRSLQTHALVTGDHLYHLVPSEPLIVGDCFIELLSSILTTYSTQALNTRSPTGPKNLMVRCFFRNFSI